MKLLPQKLELHQLSPDWKYISASKTDVAKTFRRIRDKLALEQKPKQQSKVRELKRITK